MHELNRETEPERASERSFGLTVATLGAIVALWPLLHGGHPRWWLVTAAVVLCVISMLACWMLAPLNRAWSRFGLTLNRIVSPVVLAIVFFGILTPLGLILRARGRDPLRLKLERNVTSYWIMRQPPGPKPTTMTRQF
jgi:predicted membrane metal-binding protein